MKKGVTETTKIDENIVRMSLGLPAYCRLLLVWS